MLRGLPGYVVLGASLLAIMGCAKVRPQADYARTAHLIRLRVPATQVYAADSASVLPPDIGEALTLDQALQRAMMANRDLQAVFGDIGVARADLVQTALWKNPTLALSGMLPEGGGRTKLTLGLAQDIVDLWQIPVRKKIAQANLDEAIFKVVNQAVDLAASTKQAYHRLQSARRAEQIARDNIEIAQRSDEAAQARYAAGQVGKTDVDLARTSLLQARLTLIEIIRQTRVAQNELALLMGLDQWPDALVALDPLPGAPPSPSEADAVRVALAERLDLQAQRRAVQAARQRVREEWLKIFPTIELGFDMERPERRAFPGRKIGYDTLVTSLQNGQLTAPSIQTRGERQREKRQEINEVLGPGFTMVLPIFDQNQAQIAKAVIQHEQEQRRYEGLTQRVQKDVRTALANYLAAAGTVEFYQVQLLPQLQQSLETATASYRAGTTGIVAVLDAQRSLVSSTSDLNKAQLDQLQTQDELEKALGGPLVWQHLSAASQPSGAAAPPREQSAASAPAPLPEQ